MPGVMQVSDADTDEVAAQYEQNRPNDVEPESVEERTSDDEPDPGEDEQQTAEQTGPWEQRTAQPPLD
jgi:hypothetical protein